MDIGRQSINQELSSPQKKNKTQQHTHKKPVHNCSKVLTEVSLEDAD